MEPTPATQPKPKHLSDKQTLWLKYCVSLALLSFIILIFSLFMSQVADYREGISSNNYDEVSRVYNGPLTQASPSVTALDSEDALYQDYDLKPVQATYFAENTTLASTTGAVVVTAEFVKKGLSYLPTYRTDFTADYVLKNDLAEESVVSFQFPFPDATTDGEVSNARLFVDGVEMTNAKTSITLSPQYVEYDYYGSTSATVMGLRWDGKIPAQGNVNVTVQYQTVGLDLFTYEGIDNPNGAQDFNFTTTINGIRSYDVPYGLSVDQKTFGPKSVTLQWNKPALYSKPVVAVQVGERVNPSQQVSRIYFVMAPVYLVFMIIVLFLVMRFGRKPLDLFDLFMVTVLYVLFFPLVHYLSSFTIDPTIELFANFKSVPYFSMPLYGAFGLAWLGTVGVVLYYLARLQGVKFTMKFIFPTTVLFMGFFPLVVTVPEYSVLLALIGVLALVLIIVQTRIQSLRQVADRT
ncbi:MAG: hypothetical protein HY565_00490 [Candidatus Kerfeldbacteria bacterium]|nr:hypothetical protein [Candidatus Kerfeldbacteria bacterium]